MKPRVETIGNMRELLASVGCRVVDEPQSSSTFVMSWGEGEVVCGILTFQGKEVGTFRAATRGEVVDAAASYLRNYDPDAARRLLQHYAGLL